MLHLGHNLLGVALTLALVLVERLQHFFAGVLPHLSAIEGFLHTRLLCNGLGIPMKHEPEHICELTHVGVQRLLPHCCSILCSGKLETKVGTKRVVTVTVRYRVLLHHDILQCEDWETWSEIEKVVPGLKRCEGKIHLVVAASILALACLHERRQCLACLLANDSQGFAILHRCFSIIYHTAIHFHKTRIVFFDPLGNGWQCF
mmetsp:Transcript_104685/g.249251  ORF Transcript_104685/g.249251 Transcript_104685/m.249251 type:complete len:203 (+) Transcript_104685:336-944(+)